MFDDIIFRTFSKEPIKLNKLELEQKRMEKQAKDVVDTFLMELQSKKNKIEVDKSIDDFKKVNIWKIGI